MIAILTMLTLLAAAAGVGLARSADAIGSAIAGRVTVQIVTANPVTRRKQAAALRAPRPRSPLSVGARDDREELRRRSVNGLAASKR